MRSAPNHVSVGETSQERIQQWLIQAVAAILALPPGEIDPTRTFDSYGLDSSASIGLTAELAQWLNRGLDPTLLYDYDTIRKVAEHLARKG